MFTNQNGNRTSLHESKLKPTRLIPINADGPIRIGNETAVKKTNNGPNRARKFQKSKSMQNASEMGEQSENKPVDFSQSENHKSPEPAQTGMGAFSVLKLRNPFSKRKGVEKEG